ncbi:MAG: hypothetical protein R3C45_12480 [Phycisphaerales bacterium]
MGFLTCLVCPNDSVFGFGSVPNTGPTNRFADGSDDNTIPAIQETSKATPLIFQHSGTPGTGNQIWITDPDINSNELQVTLELRESISGPVVSPAVGSLTLGGTNGLSFSYGDYPPGAGTGKGDGIDDQEIQFRTVSPSSTGLSVAEAALNGLTFTPANDFIGRVILWIESNDLGNEGSYNNGWPHDITNTDSIVINVIPSMIALSGALEDTPFAVSHSALANAAFPNTSGQYAGEDVTFYIDAIDSGKLTKGDVEVVGPEATPDQLDGTVRIAQGEQVVWHPDANISGSDVAAFKVSFKDSGGWQSRPIPVKMDVQVVNRPPVVTIEGDKVLSAVEDVAYSDLTATRDDPEDTFDPTVSWVKVSGPTNGVANFTNSGGPITDVTFSEPGKYVLRITATDSVGKTNFDEVTFNVTPAGQAGPAITIQNPVDGQIYPQSGSHIPPLRALITDSDGDLDQSTITFEIYRGSQDLVASFTGRSDTESTNEYTCEWTPGQGGLYVIRVRASDTVGNSSVTSRVINILTEDTLSFLNNGSDIDAIVSGGDQYGVAVDVSGDFAIVGAPLFDLTGASNTGKIYFLRRNGTSWTTTQSFDLNDFNRTPGDDRLGTSVAIDGYHAVAGAPKHQFGSSEAGQVFILKFNPATDSWEYEGRLWEESAYTNNSDRESHHFGSAVALEGDTLVVAAEGNDNNNSSLENRGRVYIYKLDDDGNWTLEDDVVPMGADGTNPSRQKNAFFGSAVALSGNTLVVASDRRDIVNDIDTDEGEVFLYDNINDDWKQTDRITPDIITGVSVREAGAQFGFSVAIQDNTLVIGELRRDTSPGSIADAGAAYVFMRNGSDWDLAGGQQLIPTTSSTAGDLFGAAVAIHNGVIAVGANQRDHNGATNSGAVYTFKHNETQWQEDVILAPGVANEAFGQGLAISDTSVVVGAKTAGRVVIYGPDAPYVELTQPSYMASNAYEEPITVEAVISDPQGNSTISTTSVLIDGVPSGLLSPITDTGTYQIEFSGASALSIGKHNIVVRVTDSNANTVETQPTDIYVYAPNNTLSGTDGDNIDDDKELLYFGNLNEATQGQTNDINNGIDPTVGSGDPYISTVFPRVGSTVAAPIGYFADDDGDPDTTNSALALVINTANLPTDPNDRKIEILDRFGNDITLFADIINNGAEIAIKQYYDANHDINELTSKYLSGITHQYTITIDDTTDGGTTPEKTYTIFFRVDPTLPVVTAKPNGRRVSEESIEVTLTANEEVQWIEYQMEGDSDSTKVTASSVILPAFNQSTVLTFRAKDLAGNLGPETTEYYAFGDELDRVTGFVASYDPANNEVDLAWNEWAPPTGDDTPIVGYHIYRAINPVDVRRLQESLDKGYPPPHYLRVTDSSTAPQHETTQYTDDDLTPGITAWYGVTITTADGNESVISDLTQATTDLIGSTTDVAVATKRAARWLLAQQADAGYWGEDPDNRIIATSQALNALGRVNGFAAEHQDVIERGLAYLAGHFEDNNDAIARAADTLQRYGRDTTGLHERLKWRALRENGTEDIQGWGLQQRYYPDPLHTALGAIARRTSGTNGQLLDDIVGFLTDTSPATTLLSIVGTERYGWAPRNKDSIYVSALVYRATDQHRPMTTPTAHDWIFGLTPELGDAVGSYRNNILDTAAALLYLPADESTSPKRSESISYLVSQQDDSGSWSNDVFLTALCLEAVTEKKALLLHGSNPVSSSTNALKAALVKRGFEVDLVDTTSTVDLSQAANSQLIIVAGDTVAAPVGDALRGVGVPVIVCTSNLYSDMAMTGSGINDTGTISSNQIENLLTTHPLASGITGPNVTVFTSNNTISWGVPVNGRPPISYLTSNATHATVFIYEVNDPMAGGYQAPARRVGLFLGEDANELTDEGTMILDAAIEWASTPMMEP